MRALLFTIALFALSASSPRQLSIKGKWIEEGDKKSMVVITDSKYMDVYDHHTVYSGNYKRSVTSCDLNYMKNDGTEKLDFLKVEDGRCFEIMGITANRLTLMYTGAAKLHVFVRAKER